MKICPNCNSKLDNEDVFCNSCGANVAAVQPQPADFENNQQAQPNNQQSNPQYSQQSQGTYQPYQPYHATSRPINVGQLVWSIISIVIMMFSLPSFIMGIIALVKTINATTAPTDFEAAENLRIAKNLNIAATVVAGVILVLFIIIFVGVVAASVGTIGYYFNRYY